MLHSATIEDVILYNDEPQVLTLRSGDARLLAVAIPSSEDNYTHISTVLPYDWSMYIATVISDDWEYKEDDFNRCLRNPFLNANSGDVYHFSMYNMDNSTVNLLPWIGLIEEEYLVSP